MEATTADQSIRTAPAERRSLRGWAGWHYVPGIAFVVVGILAIAEPPLASLAASIYVGAMLCVAGGFMLVGGLANIRHRGGWIGVMLGLLSLIAGIVFLGDPAASAVTFVRLLAIWLVIGGLMELGIGLNLPVGRGWLILVSVVNIGLGVLIFMMQPAAAFRLLGYFVGASLLFQGLWSLTFTAGLDEARRSAI